MSEIIYFKLKELKEYLEKKSRKKISYQTIYRWIKLKLIPVRKIKLVKNHLLRIPFTEYVKKLTVNKLYDSEKKIKPKKVYIKDIAKFFGISSTTITKMLKQDKKRKKDYRLFTFIEYKNGKYIINSDKWEKFKKDWHYKPEELIRVE